MLQDYYLLAFCVGVLLGVFLISLGWLLAFGVLGGFTLVMIAPKRLRIIAGLFFVGLAAAGLIMFFQAKKVEYFREVASGGKISFTARVKQQEIKYSSKQRLVIEIISSEKTELLGEKVVVSTWRFPVFKRGYKIEGFCNLTSPKPFDGFAYDKYLASQNTYFICENFKGNVLDSRYFSWRHPFAYLNESLAKFIESLWVRPSSALVLGLLVGSRESFSEMMLQDFSRSGITHIIALSGFNITILIVFFDALAIRLLIGKSKRIIIIVMVIVLFTIFVGAAASIVRAAIMGSMVILSSYVARQVYPWRLLVASATIMVMFQPNILVYDVGFQLSFLSTIGLLEMTPFFEKWFAWLPNVIIFKESLVTTLAAMSLTMPLVLFNFGQLSVVAPLANMLILPLIPIIMAAAALATLVAFLNVTIAGPLIFLVDLACRYVFYTSHFFANLSWASFPLSFSSSTMALSYVLLGLLIVGKKIREKNPNLISAGSPTVVGKPDGKGEAR